MTPLPFCLGAGDRSVSDRPADSPIEFSSSAPALFAAFQPLCGDSAPVFFGATSLPGRVPIANRLPQSFKPVACPRELDAQYREPDRNNDNCRPGRYQHNDADKQHGCTKHRNDNATRGLVGQMHSPFNQRTLPEPVMRRLILRLATVALPQ